METTYIVWFRDGSCLCFFGTSKQVEAKYGHKAIKIEEA